MYQSLVLREGYEITVDSNLVLHLREQPLKVLFIQVTISVVSLTNIRCCVYVCVYVRACERGRLNHNTGL